MSDTNETPNRKRRTLVIVSASFVIEAVLILGVWLAIGQSSDVRAADALEVQAEDDEKIVEVLVLDSRLPNNKTGVTYLYDTEIYVQVSRRHVDRVAAELEQFQNEIRAELTAIWRTSEPHHFDEPRLENLTRKVHALLAERFGRDPRTGHPIATKSVVVMGTGFRVDG